MTMKSMLPSRSTEWMVTILGWLRAEAALAFQKPPLGFDITNRGICKHLNSYGAIEHGIAGPVHDAHAALAQERFHGIVRKSRTDHVSWWPSVACP